MKAKDLYRIINESISEFDFLGVDNLHEDEDFENLLNSKDFQVKLVYELSKKDSPYVEDMKVIYETSDIEDLEFDEGEKINFQLNIEFVFNYNDNKIPMSLYIDGNNVPFSSKDEFTSGNYFTEPKAPTLTGIDYEYADIFFYDGEGGIELEFDWLNNNKQLKSRLISNLLEKFDIIQ